MEPAVVHEAERYVVLVKPPGMLSVPGKSPDRQGCLAAWVRAAFARSRGPLVVHRLDMETSGLMVFALDEEAQRDLSAQFERRDTEKAYVALLGDDLEQDHGEIDLPLRADLSDRPRQVVDPVKGREALTRFRVLSRETDRTRVLFLPITGRTHQIRVHTADPRGLARPILGDVLYGDRSGAERLMLHASVLTFREPGSHRRVEFVNAPPF